MKKPILANEKFFKCPYNDNMVVFDQDPDDHMKLTYVRIIRNDDKELRKWHFKSFQKWPQETIKIIMDAIADPNFEE